MNEITWWHYMVLSMLALLVGQGFWAEKPNWHSVVWGVTSILFAGTAIMKMGWR